MSANHEGNDRKRAWDPRRGKGGSPHGKRPQSASESESREWLWGWHAVESALANPARPTPKRLLVTAERAARLAAHGSLVEIVETNEIVKRLPQGAVHQGVALQTPPLEPVDLDELATPAKGFIVMLDQITDPQNVGALFRSAAAFGARGMILQDRNAPLLTGTLAKAAAGAIDRIPHAAVVNLSRALERLADLGWRAVGLDGTAESDLADALDGTPTVLVLGSEGEGIRRLVAEHCDTLAKIPMPGGFESLNVSAAGAIALYEASRARSTGI
ncbi:MAG: rRNA ((2251)-2-O)-methyltransferase RlmB [Caulobacter sp.]|nr:rRNA ((2251)-2-O)-methyltransferase RlmB [Caulobacter sp.]